MPELKESKTGNPAPKPTITHGVQPRESLQTTTFAKGTGLQEFECWLCKLNFVDVKRRDGKGTRAMVRGFVAEEIDANGLKIEPHLVYGTEDGRFDKFGGIGWNQQIIPDLKIPVKLYFPKGTITQGKTYKAGDIIVDVPNKQGNRIMGFDERKFYIWTWEGSKTVEEQAKEIRERYTETSIEEL